MTPELGSPFGGEGVEPLDRSRSKVMGFSARSPCEANALVIFGVFRPLACVGIVERGHHAVPAHAPKPMTTVAVRRRGLRARPARVIGVAVLHEAAGLAAADGRGAPRRPRKAPGGSPAGAGLRAGDRARPEQVAHPHRAARGGVMRELLGGGIVHLAIVGPRDGRRVRPLRGSRSTPRARYRRSIGPVSLQMRRAAAPLAPASVSTRNGASASAITIHGTDRSWPSPWPGTGPGAGTPRPGCRAPTSRSAST